MELVLVCRCVSLDGDADRLVYFIVPPKSSGRIDLVDGDKILSLFALFIREQLSFLNEKEDMKNCHQAHVGVIQTAYANGASTNYLKLLGLEVNFTPTGVKYLHEKATEFDIGIYFEANGHGTVLFSESFIESLEARTNEISLGSKGSEGEKAALRLLALSKLINQAVGDALSGFLLVEVILQHMGWSINKWNELYHDLPSKQLKVKVADRTAVVTVEYPCNLAMFETVVVSPPGLQEAINEETAKNPQGRCFVRPSGTEDVVRVYAEASTQEAADTLANCVAKLGAKLETFSLKNDGVIRIRAATASSVAPRIRKTATCSVSKDGNASVETDVPFPADYSELLEQARVAADLAIKDNRQLMIEFPTAGLGSVPGDGEGGIEMTESMQLIREFCDRFISSEKATRTRIVIFLI
ncbi:hypothetical protein JHK85_045487 [Glycine max]|nr:hypothetical protein JHK85_045487 [Glycine max]